MKRQVLLALILCLAVSVFAQKTIPLESIVSAEIAEVLRSEGKMQHIAYKDRNYELTLKPSTTLSVEASKTWTGRKRPVFVAETLYLIKKETSTDFGADIPLVGQILTSLSTMKGIPYVNSDGATLDLYIDIYAVNNLEDKERVADNNKGSADGKQIYTFQEMRTFGTGHYEYLFRQSNTEVMCTSQNMDYVTWKVFRLVNPGSFRMSFVVTDLGDSLLMYNLAEAEFFAISAVEQRMTQAFTRRSDAVYDWFNAAYAEQSSKE